MGRKRRRREYLQVGEVVVPCVVRKAHIHGVFVTFACTDCTGVVTCRTCRDLERAQKSSMPPQAEPLQ